MILSPILVSSDSKNRNKIQRYSGIGTVQIDQKSEAVIIKTAREQIIAEYDGLQLQSGDAVRYTLINDKLYLEKTTYDSNAINEADSFVRQHFADAGKILSLVDTFIDNLDQYSNDQFKQKIYSILETLTGLSKEFNPETITKIRSLIENSNFNSDSIRSLKDLFFQLQLDLSKPAALYQGKYAELSIDTLPGAILQVNKIDDFLDSMDLPNDIFNDLKNLIKNSKKQFVRIIPCGNTTLAALFSSEDTHHELKSIIANFSSRQLQSIPVKTLESVIKSRNFLDLDLLNSIDVLLTNTQQVWYQKRAGSEHVQQWALNQWLLTTLDNKPILQELVSRYPGTASSLMTLIKQFSPINTSLEHFGITADLVDSIRSKADLIPSIMNRLGYNLEHELLTSSHANQPSMKEFILKNQYSDSNLSSTETVQKTFYITGNPIYNSLEFSDFLKTTTSEVLKFISFISPEIEEKTQIKDLLLSIRESISEISKITKNIEKNDINNEADETWNSLIKKEAEQLVSKIGMEIKLLCNKIQAIRPGISLELFEKLMDLAETSQKTIEKFLISDTETQQKNDIKQDIPPNNGNENKDTSLSNSLEKNIKNDSTSINQHSKQITETLLNRFESLQILSKITPTPEGDQQIMALPMNIGGEWTELNIRFVNKKNLRKKSAQKLFVVQLDVAPSKLGAITVRMEYELKKKFQLKIEFDKKQTMEWFLQNRNTLSKSLCNLGLPLVNLELNAIKTQEHNSEQLMPKSGAIDFKI